MLSCLVQVNIVYSSVRTNEGNDITITCEAISSSYPPLTIEWNKNDGSLSDRVSIGDAVSLHTDSRNISRTVVNLTITNAFKEDTGVYNCFASNNISNDSSDVKITIQC